MMVIMNNNRQILNERTKNEVKDVKRDKNTVMKNRPKTETTIPVK